MTEEMPTVHDVLETLNAQKSDSESESDDSEGEVEQIFPEISATTVAQHLETIKYWLMHKENGDQHFPALYKLEEFVEQTRMQSLKQRNITEYFRTE